MGGATNEPGGTPSSFGESGASCRKSIGSKQLENTILWEEGSNPKKFACVMIFKYSI
jgi:hypothetical protein